MIKIAIIEDHALVLDLLTEFINLDENIKIVGTYGDGESALVDLPQLNPDIVLVDIGLPGISGIDCINRLKETDITSKFMINSSFGDEENIFRALESGATSYILKTAKPQEIIKAIHELYHGGSPMSSQVAKYILNRFFTQKEKKVHNHNLTSRELEILEQLSKGLLYKEISHNLNISINTLKVHCYNIYQKLHVNNKIEAINMVFNNNL